MSIAQTPDNPNTGITKMDKLKLTLSAESVQQQFKNALGENSGGFTASIIDLFASDSYLQECDPAQVILCCLKAAVMKLPINKALGFAYVIAYKGKPQFQIGWKGLVQLAIRSSMYKFINVDAVLDGEYVLKNKLTGEFDLTGMAKNNTIIGYFAHFELLNGFSKTLYMPKEKVEAHGTKYSQSYTQPYGPWKKEFDAMAMKTVLKLLLSKYGYLSVDLGEALGNDDVADQVAGEIEKHGNTQPFETAEVVDNPPAQNAQVHNMQQQNEDINQQNTNNGGNQQATPGRIPF